MKVFFFADAINNEFDFSIEKIGHELKYTSEARKSLDKINLPNLTINQNFFIKMKEIQKNHCFHRFDVN